MQTLYIVFGLPIIAIGIPAMWYATSYLNGANRLQLTRFWAFYVGTLAAMLGVVFAANEVIFLLAWEAMGLASAGLVAFEHREREVRKATWVYLLACHAGACFLMLAGVVLMYPEWMLAAFVCAIIGFGLKIGFPPFHVWLPEAHPAAPAPASALMSGAMIPLGFYGILRFFPIGVGMEVEGWILLVLGAMGAFLGILFALPQSNLKRLLAFSSVENMGVVGIGLGLAYLAGGSMPMVRDMAYAGAIAHILNHAMLKGNLFLGAGSVLRQTGTLNQDLLGGLMRKMPFTGTFFALAALGLSGLPPLNGFLGELLIYVAAFNAITSGVGMLSAAGFLAIVVLAMVGGLSIAVYCKAFGTTFLGAPRTDRAENAVETPKRMWLAQLALFVGAMVMVPGTIIIAHHFTGGASDRMMITAAVLGLGMTVMTVALIAIRRWLCSRGGEKPACLTWDCGYEQPTARMAYTATAFTQPLVDTFDIILKPRHHLVPFRGYPSKPTEAAFATVTDDGAMARLWRPVFTRFARLAQLAHLLQNGSLHFYILIIILALVGMLAAAFLI